MSGMDELDIQHLGDDNLRVCLMRDGIRACTHVSSWHLAEDKRPQLQRAIQRRAAQAFRSA